MKQLLKYIIYSTLSILAVWGTASCSDIDDNGGTEDYSLAGTPINVSAIAEELEVSIETRGITSRAVEENFTSKKAETVKWLQGALKNGLDITYSNMTETQDTNGKVKEIRDKHNERVAILKWTGNFEGDRGVYTFYYKGTKDPAKWNANGLHYFEGQYVPAEIRDKNDSGSENAVPATLTSDQHDDTDYTYDGAGNASGSIGNYTLLSHYIGMPPSWKTSATIDQVNLPFKHRLGRVLAYVLIDESLNTTLRGYTSAVRDGEGNFTQKDDPLTTYFHFNNVKVLDYVKVGSKIVGKDSENKDITVPTLTPIWKGGYPGEFGNTDKEREKPARRVIPHFFDEVNKSVTKTGNVVDGVTDADANTKFIVYENVKDEKRTYPRDSGWKAIHQNYRTSGGVVGDIAMTEDQVTTADEKSGYRRYAYSKVPIYDIIVRPTYNNTYDNVMYDEEGYYNANGTTNDSKIQSIYGQSNSILFELELESGLQYSKTFTFDLNANQQTVVYLTIDRAGISYDESSYETWNATTGTDGYYGVDNGEDVITHNLSEVGSSWQRAIRNGDKRIGNNTSDITDGNFYDDDKVNNGSTGRGQYMNPVEWTKEFAKAWAKFGEDNKTPTEHGDRHGYYFMLDKDIDIDMRLIPNDFIFTGHLDGKGHKITLTHTKETVKYVTANDQSIIDKLKNITYKDNNTNTEKYHLPELYELFKIDNIEDRGEGEWVIPNLNVIESVEERGEGEWVIPNLDAVNGNENRDDGNWDNTNLNGVEGNENRGDGWATRASSGKTRAEEEKTYYIMVKVTDSQVLDELKNGTISAINNTGTIQKYYYKKTPTSFSKFNLDPHSVYLEENSTDGRNSYLFTGLNGIYVTKQEFLGGETYVEHPSSTQLTKYSNNHGIWEANVHAEYFKINNTTGIYSWVPYNGYRGEILNVEISGGYFFPTDIKIGKEQTDKVNGYIINCKNNDKGLLQNIVDIPKYKYK